MTACAELSTVVEDALGRRLIAPLPERKCPTCGLVIGYEGASRQIPCPRCVQPFAI